MKSCERSGVSNHRQLYSSMLWLIPLAYAYEIIIASHNWSKHEYIFDADLNEDDFGIIRHDNRAWACYSSSISHFIVFSYLWKKEHLAVELSR